MRRLIKWLIGGAVAVVVAVPVGVFVYIHFIEADPPPKLSLATRGNAAVAPGDISGTWRPTAGSIVGYRVNEILLGQRNIAVGRTSKVSGTLRIDGTNVVAARLAVDMGSMTSDQSRRDAQFRGRIMDVSSFPTTTFELTQPIALPSVPNDSTPISVTARGRLTLRGTTRDVTVPLRARRNGTRIEVQGSIPITFADWNIPNPSIATITTEDHGLLELFVVFERAG